MKKVKKFLADFQFLAILVVSLVLLVFGTGCANTGRAFWERVQPGCTQRGVWIGTGSLLDPIPMAILPPDPVRRVETWVVNPYHPGGTYQFHHSQGTDNSVRVGWDPYTGRPNIDAQQRTYSTTSETLTPRVWYPVRGW